jgi:hypothetical protein
MLCVRYVDPSHLKNAEGQVDTQAGPASGNAAPPEYCQLPPCMARNMSIFIVWTVDPDFVVSLGSCLRPSTFPSLASSILMQWAEGGSLDDFIHARLGVASPHPHHDDDPTPDETQSRSARIRAFRAAQARPEQTRTRRSEQRKAERGRAVHLLSAEEVKDIFNDIVSGLGFLVSSHSVTTAKIGGNGG